MAVTIRIPTPLRKFTAEKSTVEVEATDVSGAMQALVAKYPDLRGQLLDDQGAVRRFVNVYLNDEDIRFLDSFTTPVKNGDELSVIPAIAGGASDWA